MKILLKHTARIGSLLVCTTLACSAALSQNTDRPDLEGIWTNASLTKLSRPRGVDSLVVSAEEARLIATNTPIAGLQGGAGRGGGGLAAVDDRGGGLPFVPGRTLALEAARFVE